MGLGVAWYALVGWGLAWQQLQTAARSFVRGSLLLSLEGRLGTAWIGKLRTGAVGRGEVIAADGSTGAFGLLCCSRKGVVTVRLA